MRWEKMNATDQDIIAKQIQRQPRNVCGIARRCPRHCPQVIVNRPLPQTETDAEFFPTVFWLTCPVMVSRIGRIEDQGYIRRIQTQVREDGELSQNLRDAHLEYIYVRNALLERTDRLHLRQTRRLLSEEMSRLGIGGVADLNSIKCLHTHYAHYLATYSNPVGLLVEKLLSLQEADGECRQCWKNSEQAGVAE